ncbi:hypothetical protein QR685DRAFT_556176 [Neurospora intermedia]|uniref:Uncharacterized protein n=1 Tax=Neurospora intermedia TaxID=5142 RepID=A0ABR3D4H0_NEUIN
MALESYYTDTYHPSGEEKGEAGDIPRSNPYGQGFTTNTSCSDNTSYGDGYGSLTTSMSEGEGGSLGLGSESQTTASAGTGAGGGGEEKK